jgi:hypothetical protein
MFGVNNKNNREDETKKILKFHFYFKKANHSLWLWYRLFFLFD